MTGLFGIGGGFLAIPVLVLFFGTPQAVAAGTSLLIIAINSLISFLGHHALWADVKWHIPVFMGAAAIIDCTDCFSLFRESSSSPKVCTSIFAYLALCGITLHYCKDLDFLRVEFAHSDIA
jgi:hypothetical protein